MITDFVRTSSGVRFGYVKKPAPRIPEPKIIPEEELPSNKGTEVPVRQYTVNGAFIAEYPSASEAARAVGGKPGNITKNCRGYAHSSAGFIFRYASDPPPAPLVRTVVPKLKEYYAKSRQRIEQLTLDDVVIATYESQKDAAEAVGGKAATMSQAVNGNVKTYKGYKWRKINV